MERLPIGSSETEIYRELGAPEGKLELPTRTVLFYPTAELTVVEGKLNKAVWRTQEAVDAEKELQAKLREDWEHDQALKAEENQKLGEKILEARRSNPAFQSLPPAQRLRSWSDFLRDYPTVDASAEYETALADVRTEAAARELERSIAQESLDDSRSQRSLVDTVEVGTVPGLGAWGYVGPSVAVGNKAVVVVGGNGGFGYGYCTPAQSRPILDVSYRSENVSVRYSSGERRPLRKDPYDMPRQPVVIYQGDQ